MNGLGLYIAHSKRGVILTRCAQLEPLTTTPFIVPPSLSGRESNYLNTCCTSRLATIVGYTLVIKSLMITIHSASSFKFGKGRGQQHNGEIHDASICMLEFCSSLRCALDHDAYSIHCASSALPLRPSSVRSSTPRLPFELEISRTASLPASQLDLRYSRVLAE